MKNKIKIKMAFLRKVADDYFRNPVSSSRLDLSLKRGKNINECLKDADFADGDTHFNVKYCNIHLVSTALDTELADLDAPKIVTSLEETGIYHMLYHGSLYGLATVVSAATGSTDYHSISTIKGSSGVYNKFIVRGAWHDSNPAQPLTVNANVTLQLWSSPGENYGMINKESIVCKATGAEMEIFSGFQIASAITLSDGSTTGTLSIFEDAIISSEITLGTTATKIYLKGKKFNFKPEGIFKGGHPNADAVTHGTMKFIGTGVNLTIHHDDTMDSKSVKDFYDILVASLADGLTGNIYFPTGSKLDVYDKTFDASDQINAN